MTPAPGTTSATLTSRLTLEELEELRASLLCRAATEASRRKRRLLATAFARRTWSLLPKSCRKGIELAERFADGIGSVKEMIVAARRTLQRAEMTSVARPEVGHASWSVYHALAPFSLPDHVEASHSSRRALILAGADSREELVSQCNILLDAIGDAPHSRHLVEHWQAWNDACVARVASRIYDERRFDDMPILHDALLDAGCDEEQILAHCREPLLHERGCWVLDFLMGRE